jgi:hypothetical protein
MKPPVIIWQKPEYKQFGKVGVAVLVSPTLIIDQKRTPEVVNFNHRQWTIPDGVNPFGYKAISIKQLPSNARVGGDGLIDHRVYEQYVGWVDEFVGRAPTGKECFLIPNGLGEYAVMIPKTKKVKIMAVEMEYPFRWITHPLFAKNKKIDCDNVSLVETDGEFWDIPIGTDTMDYWTPILCIGSVLPKINKGGMVSRAIGPFYYNTMTEQEAWGFVKKHLLEE